VLAPLRAPPFEGPSCNLYLTCVHVYMLYLGLVLSCDHCLCLMYEPQLAPRDALIIVQHYNRDAGKG
jgi:hypothetical protein